MSRKIELGVALMPEQSFLQAVLPLFKKEQIDVIEWSFDTFSNYQHVPDWLKGLLSEYGQANKLIGHGVYYSLFAAKWTSLQDTWLAQIKEEVKRNQYTHISEHFGFMSSANYHKAYPLPIPLHTTTLAIGIDRLKRLADAVQLPVGIENLAFSFSKKDVFEQGIFVEKLITEIGGFVLLDLHNIYCQAHNFDLDMMELIECYPLNEVKEIHLSGGSWQDSVYRKDKIRRDTHDGALPPILFDILPKVIAKCPNLEFVIIERLGNTFNSKDSMLQYQRDFVQVKKIIDSINIPISSKKWGLNFHLAPQPIQHIALDQEQKKLVKMLMHKESISKIKDEEFEFWDTSDWDIGMIETATNISKKWMGDSLE